MAIITPQPKSLKELISDRYYEIPLYQRPYDWGVDQVSDLWDDIDKNDQGYFLGIVLFRPLKLEDSFPTEFHIVDGQQRLATLLLLLRAAIESLELIDAKREAVEYQKEYIAQASAGEDENMARLTLVLSKRDKDKWEDLTLEHILAEKLKWEGREEYLERLGNLTLLSHKMNTKTANKPFKEKKKDYKKEKRVQMTKDLLDFPDFNKDKIIERQEKLAEHAVKIWNAKRII